ncbi:MAG: MATE family efflux transporter, partial [Clostridium sp.]|nr:MATE family efflux transporter [Clostridium sp.]
NIILDPFMIFGYGPFPAMGISGAAFATGIGQCLTLIIYIMIMILRPIPVRAQLRYLHPDGILIRRLYQVGVPATLNTALPSVQVSVLNQILTAFSAQYVLILGIYYKLQTFIYLTANGMVQGIRPLVGYNAGAGEPKRVEKIFTTSMLLIMGIMLVGTILSWLFPLQIFGLFAKDPAAIKIGGHALQIISLGFIVSGISVTCSGVLEGLGHGGSSLLISLSRYIIVMLPMAFLLSRFLKTDGVWYAFVVTEFLTAGLSLLIWKKTRSVLYCREGKEHEDKVERKESL